MNRRMAVVQAAVLLGACVAEAQTITSTFNGEFHNQVNRISATSCSSLPSPNWVPSGTGFQLTTSVSTCGTTKVTAGIQINVAISPATITGFVSSQSGFSFNYYLRTP